MGIQQKLGDLAKIWGIKPAMPGQSNELFLPMISHQQLLVFHLTDFAD
jgi:hypothetical protein